MKNSWTNLWRFPEKFLSATGGISKEILGAILEKFLVKIEILKDISIGNPDKSLEASLEKFLVEYSHMFKTGALEDEKISEIIYELILDGISEIISVVIFGKIQVIFGDIQNKILGGIP